MGIALKKTRERTGRGVEGRLIGSVVVHALEDVNFA